MGWGLRCALLWVSILAVVTNAEGSWQVEHAFGDDAFSPAGTLSESFQASKWLSSYSHLPVLPDMCYPMMLRFTHCAELRSASRGCS